MTSTTPQKRKHRRRRWTDEQKRAIVAEAAKARATGVYGARAALCKRHGIGFSLLQRWEREGISWTKAEEPCQSLPALQQVDEAFWQSRALWAEAILRQLLPPDVIEKALDLRTTLAAKRIP